MVEQFTGQVQILDSDSEEVTIALSGDHAGIVAGGSGQDGDLILTDSDGNQRLWIDGQTGNILLKNAAGDFILRVVGDEGDITVYRRIDGSQRPVMGFDASSAALYLGSEGQAGDILVRNSEGDIVFKVRGHQGDIIVHRRIDGVLREVMKFDAFQAALYIGAEGNAGDIIVRDGSGNERIRLDGNAGDIRLQGADCAEEFDVVGFDTIDPGTVLVIGDDGKLRPCEKPYDKRVAGVASGGNGSTPGIILDSNPAQERRVPIALNGKVYCKVDAQISPIEIGDLLTASPVLGHAMKAEDPQKAFGAVIGKALRGLEEGRELIPILVSLQ